jgi:hypothetical protein
MKKERAIETMIEKINIYKRSVAVQNNQSLIDLEKEILASQNFYREVLLAFYQILESEGFIKEGIDL